MNRFFRLLVISLVLFAHNPAWSLLPASPQPGNLTLHYEREPLRNVLKAVSDQSGMGFVFQDDLVEGRTVTCSLECLSLDQALERILSPLSISFKRIRSGPVVLYDARTAERLIRGWVVDASSGNGLPFANIVQEGTATGTTSDTDGSFVLRNSHPDSCTIRVSYIGYHPEQIRLRSLSDRDSLRISMRETPIETESVFVEAERFAESGLSIRTEAIVFSPRKLDYIPSPEAGAFGRSLQLLPGVSAAYDHASRIGFYGGTDNENILLLDDIPIRKTGTYYGWLGPLHPRMIEKVTVWKGGYPAPYGEQAGGIIELTGNTVPECRFNAGIGADPFHANAFVEWPLTKKLRLFTGARKSHDNIITGKYYGDIDDFLMVKGLHRSNYSMWINDRPVDTPAKRRYSFSDFAARISYSGSTFDRFSSTFYYKQEKDRTVAVYDDSAGHHFNGGWERLKNWGISAKWHHEWNLSHTSAFSATYSDFHPNWIEERGTRNGDSISYLWRNHATRYRLKEWTFKLGNRLHFDKINIEYGLNFTQNDVLWREYNYNILDQLVEEKQKSLDGVINKIAYIQNRWTPTPLFSVNLGLRGIFSEFRYRGGPGYRTDSITSYQPVSWGSERHFFLEPRLSINGIIHSRLKTGISFGEYHQFIRNEDYLSLYLRPNLAYWMRFETMDEYYMLNAHRHVILDIRYETEVWGLSMEGYRKSYPQFWPQDRIGGYPGSGVAKGFSWTAQKKDGVITGWISYRLNRSEYTLDSRLSSFDGYSGGPMPADEDRTHELKGVAAFELASIRFSISGCFASGKPYTPEYSAWYGEYHSIVERGLINSSRLPSYQRVDFQITRRFNNFLMLNWEFGMSLLNIFDRKNVLYRDYSFDWWAAQQGQVVPAVPRDIPMLGFTPIVNLGVTLH